jgi:hypothetical protein
MKRRKENEGRFGRSEAFLKVLDHWGCASDHPDVNVVRLKKRLAR